MADTELNREKEKISMLTNGFSRDLFQKVLNGNCFPREFVGRSGIENVNVGEEDDEVELSLGLSLNGRFGVDPTRTNKLLRSSSVASFGINADENRARAVSIAAYAPLSRTCSLPVEADEELRKRKELQTLRRMEAKRKRMEKLKNVRAVREKIDLGECCEGNGSAQYITGINGNCQPSSQGSLGSYGSGSSGISDFDSQPVQGPSKVGEARSPSSVQSLADQNDKVARNSSTFDNLGKADRAGVKEANGAREMFKNVMHNMPCVSTRGDGPNGKKIEGFLYYRKGEEVRILCVCHGSFLSPAEFVKHAGGGDVAHPLRHIVVTPPSFL